MLIKKQGGVPIVRSLQGTVFLAETNVGLDLKKLIQKGTDWAIFTTGIGAQTLLEIAEKQGMKETFINMIQQSQTASRGYKTLSTLKKLGIMPTAVDDNGTTKSLIKSLDALIFLEKE